MSRILINAEALRNDAKMYAKKHDTSYSIMMVGAGIPSSSIANSKIQYLKESIKAGIEVDADNFEYGKLETTRLNEICEVFKLNPQKYIVETNKKSIVEDTQLFHRLTALEQAVNGIGKIQAQMCMLLKEIAEHLRG